MINFIKNNKLKISGLFLLGIISFVFVLFQVQVVFAASCSELSSSYGGWPTTEGSDNNICGESDNGLLGGCSGLMTYSEARNHCESVGARLCSHTELTNNEAANTGCGYDYDDVWTSTACSGGYYTNDGEDGGDQTCDSESSTNYVRCCATENSVSCSELNSNYGGWPTTKGDTNICGETDDGWGGCSGLKTYNEAESFCTSIGARLCTHTELRDDETEGTGCGYDYERIWTSSECSSGHYTDIGSTKSSSNKFCDSDSETHYVRCCATVNSSFPSSGLISYWSFDNNANDDYGSNNGTVTGATHTSSGKNSYAYDFDGSGDYIALSSEIVLDGTWSVAYWAYQTAGTDRVMSIGDRNENYNRFYYAIYYIGQYGIRFHPDNGGAQNFEFGNDFRGQWHHLVMTSDGSTIRAYVNGSLVDQHTMDTRFEINTIGRAYTNTSYDWDGKIDEVGIWDRDLSSTEISSLYNGGSGNFYVEPPPNSAPNTPSSPSPSSGATDISTSPSISAYYSDPDGDSGRLYFYTGAGSYLGYCNASNGSSCSITYSGASSDCTNYDWKVRAYDYSVYSSYSSTYNFTTGNCNSAPNSPSNTSPGNGADVAETTSVTLQAGVSDPNGDTMSVSFYDASDSSLIGTDASVASGGTASVTWGSLTAGSSYSWYAIANDGSLTTQSSTWNFSVNQTPTAPSSPTPSDALTGISPTPSISATYSDPDAESGTLYYYTGAGSLIGNCSVTNGSSCSVTYSGASSNCTSYNWYAVSSDGTETTQSSTWSFTTNCAPDTPTTPYPSAGGSNISFSPKLQINVSDSDGDTMDVSFYNASDSTLIGTDIGVSSGNTASTTWSGLSCKTTYLWYAIADDGSLTTQSPNFSFTTKPICSTANSSLGGGFMWIEGEDVHWTEGTTEFWIDDGTLIQSDSSINPGIVWIEGTNIHWIDVFSNERSYEGILYNAGSSEPLGKTWMADAGVIHYIDAEGADRVLNGSDEEVCKVTGSVCSIDDECCGGNSCYVDSDLDSYEGSTGNKLCRSASLGTDCDDSDSSITAATDGTCDGDGDGYIDYTAGGTDCDDDNSGITTATDGTCDGDGDGYVDSTGGGTDCDDNNASITAATDGTCDGDGDGYIDETAGGTDCNDSDSGINPGVTVDNWDCKDNDCDGVADEDSTNGCGSCVFVTPGNYSGDFGYAAAVDQECDSVADDYGLFHDYRAWIAWDETNNPDYDFDHRTDPYCLPDGTKVADNWTDLTDGSLDNPIDITPDGSYHGDAVWTNVDIDGTVYAPYNGDNQNCCAMWTCGYDTCQGWYGLNINTGTGTSWTRSNDFDCTFGGSGAALYCFQY